MKLQHYQSQFKWMNTQQQGFTLLEVMVALVIFSIGLLGLADLQIKSVDYTNGAYHRSQASFLISNIMDRMRANKNYALSGTAGSGPYQTTSTAKTTISYATCSKATSNCDKQAEEQADMYEWKQALKVLPGGDGSITLNSGAIPTFTVTVTWNDPHGKVDAATGNKISSLTVTGAL